MLQCLYLHSPAIVLSTSHPAGHCGLVLFSFFFLGLLKTARMIKGRIRSRCRIVIHRSSRALDNEDGVQRPGYAHLICLQDVSRMQAPARWPIFFSLTRGTGCIYANHGLMFCRRGWSFWSSPPRATTILVGVNEPWSPPKLPQRVSSGLVWGRSALLDAAEI